LPDQTGSYTKLKPGQKVLYFYITSSYSEISWGRSVDRVFKFISY
jgi:hypothetical protein